MTRSVLLAASSTRTLTEAMDMLLVSTVQAARLIAIGPIAFLQRVHDPGWRRFGCHTWMRPCPHRHLHAAMSPALRLIAVGAAGVKALAEGLARVMWRRKRHS